MFHSDAPLQDLEITRRRSLSVRDFFDRFQKEMELSLLSENLTLDSNISQSTVHRPGLALAGFTDVFSHHRIQVLGSTEWAFLESMGEGHRREIFSTLARFHAPLWVLAHDLPPHEELLEMCNLYQMPLMKTRLGTLHFVDVVQRVLGEWFAPYSNVHASLVDVYGVGMLYVGDSNIGKSECVLDLVERGHRLVADDSVRVSRIGKAVIGSCDEVVGHHMEIRGIGVIDVPKLFGIHAVRRVKKIEIVVELQNWSAEASYERTGLDEEFIEVMGVDIPKVIIPISSGKNITVISEVVAMNALMKMNGTNLAVNFNDRLKEIIQKKTAKQETGLHLLSKPDPADFYE